MAASENGPRSRLMKRLPAFRRFLIQRFRHGEKYGLDFTIAFVAIVGALWGFLELIEGAVAEASMRSVDTGIQMFMSRVLSPGLTEVVVFITDLGGTRGTLIGVILVGVPLLVTRRWWSAFGLVFATAGGGVIIWGLKTFFARARPADPLIHAGGFAFPSGHAFSAMVFFGYLIYLSHRHLRSSLLQVLSTISCFSMIVLIGLSRVYLNVHWLTDVLGGFIAGLAWVILSILIVRHVEWPGRGKAPNEKDASRQADKKHGGGRPERHS